MNADPSSSSVPLMAAGLAGLLSALFTCADTALTSHSDARLAAIAIETGDRFRAALARVEANRESVQARYLVGRVLSTVATVAAGWTWLSRAAVPGESRMLWALVGLVVFAALQEVASMTGRHAADVVTPRAAWGLRPFEVVLGPLAFVATALGRLLAPSRPRKPDPRITETEVEIMVDQGAASGAIDHGNAELIRKVLEFPDLTARDAMIPRKQVVAIAVDTPLDEIAEIVMKSGHSRYPVYRDDIDDVFGLLYAKDLFRVLRPLASSGSAPRVTDDGAVPPSGETPRQESTRRATSVRDIVREPVKIVPESRPLSELLRDMRHSRQHLAVVVDEFGGTSGVVTLEDVIEEIVGDIRDEHDAEKGGVVPLPDGRFLVDGAVLLCDLRGPLGRDLDPEDEYDSIGGLITDKLGHVPAVGATLYLEGVELVVREADEKRVAKVEIVLASAAPAPRSSKPGDATREAS